MNDAEWADFFRRLNEHLSTMRPKNKPPAKVHREDLPADEIDFLYGSVVDALLDDMGVRR